MKQYNEKLLCVGLCGVVLLVLIRIIIALTNLDTATIQKQTEYEKLKYFQTLNEIYGGEGK